MRDQLNCQPRCSAVGSVRAQTSRCVVPDQEGYHLPACAGAQLRPYRPAHGGGSDHALQDIGQRNGLSYPVRRYPNRVSIRKILNSRTPAWSGLVSGGETGDRGVCPRMPHAPPCRRYSYNQSGASARGKPPGEGSLLLGIKLDELVSLPTPPRAAPGARREGVPDSARRPEFRAVAYYA